VDNSEATETSTVSISATPEPGHDVVGSKRSNPQRQVSYASLGDLRVVALSGPVGAGKSTLANHIASAFGGTLIRTQDLMLEAAERAGTRLRHERRALQQYGEQLDRESDQQWVAEGVGRRMSETDTRPSLLVVDAVRTVRQVDALRNLYPGAVRHIHVHAPLPVLDLRYAARSNSGVTELASYAEVAANSTEAQVSNLAQDADVSIDTHRCTERDVLARAIAALSLNPSRETRLVDVFIGGQYGSEGKGNVAFHLAGEYDVLMRVGGPNAGHKVPTTPVYTHRSLPSGTQANREAHLLIGPGATLDLDVLLDEIAECGVRADRLTIDPQAMIIERADIEAERALVSTIASTGRGGGAAAARRIMGRHGESSPPVRLARDVGVLRPFVRPSATVLEEAFRTRKRVMLEGTQGTLLSLFHGFYPWVTSRDTTTAACLSEAGIGPHRLRKVVMVVRTYPIRVGSPREADSGVMSQEISWEEIAQRADLDVDQLRERERGSVTNTERRVAEFDWSLLRRAGELNGVTDIALTFADYLHKDNDQARRFDQLSADTIQFVEEVARVGGAPVSLVSTGFNDRPLIDRREW